MQRVYETIDSASGKFNTQTKIYLRHEQIECRCFRGRVSEKYLVIAEYLQVP